MVQTKRSIKHIVSCLLYLVQLSTQVPAGTRFASHVSVNTPARSYSHGVGDPIPSRRPNYQRPFSYKSFPHQPVPPQIRSGYPRMKPSVPFDSEDFPRGHSHSVSPWNLNNFEETSIPVLPPSPYKVDSPDPESLWPEGLFLPPLRPPRFGHIGRRSDGEVSAEPEYVDPYLLEGSEAVAAVIKSNRHGLLYFHDIPHIQSLLENQELRAANHLKPHRLGSIRHTWPYNRP